jgi:ribosome-associated protein
VQESFQMIEINPHVSIPDDELTFSASRSGGPGGQNVNKVSTKVTLSFDVRASSSLSDEQKRRIEQKLATRINNDGILRVISQRTRSQEMNRSEAVRRFSELLSDALTPETPRIKTRVSRAVKERRLEEKKKRTQIKKGRSDKGWD